MNKAAGLLTSTDATRGCPVMTPISPTVVTGKIVATFSPSAVMMASSPESSTNISSGLLPLSQTRSPGLYVWF